MFKRLCALILALLLLCPVFAEGGFDGQVYSAYSLIYDEGALSGLDVISYIEPSGLLLSAYGEQLDISVTLEEANDAPAQMLAARAASAARYGNVIFKSEVSAFSLPSFPNGAYISYSYRSLRDSGSGEVYTVDAYIFRVNDELALSVSQTSWGDDGARQRFNASFVPALGLQPRRISTEYVVFLVACDRLSDGLYVTIDPCRMEYDSNFGLPYAVNDDPTLYTVKLSAQAEIWLPEMSGALYSMVKSAPQEAAIRGAIEEFYARNQVEPIFTLLFDAGGEVIRLQHYNAL